MPSHGAVTGATGWTADFLGELRYGARAVDRGWLQRAELVMGIVVVLVLVLGWLVSQFIA